MTTFRKLSGSTPSLRATSRRLRRAIDSFTTPTKACCIYSFFCHSSSKTRTARVYIAQKRRAVFAQGDLHLDITPVADPRRAANQPGGKRNNL